MFMQRPCDRKQTETSKELKEAGVAGAWMPMGRTSWNKSQSGREARVDSRRALRANVRSLNYMLSGVVSTP